jgi:hypothetical protein
MTLFIWRGRPWWDSRPWPVLHHSLLERTVLGLGVFRAQPLSENEGISVADTDHGLRACSSLFGFIAHGPAASTCLATSQELVNLVVPVGLNWKEHSAGSATMTTLFLA